MDAHNVAIDAAVATERERLEAKWKASMPRQPALQNYEQRIKELEAAQESGEEYIRQYASRIKELEAFLRRCGDHMICGSNIADTPLPTEAEWRDILLRSNQKK